MKNKIKGIIYTLLAFAPVLTFAQNANTQVLTDIVSFIANTVRSLIPIMFGLAVVYFFWGLITYLRAAGDPKKAGEGKTIMIYGVIAIAVMASIFGLVAWLQGIFGIDATTTARPPTVTGLGT